MKKLLIIAGLAVALTLAYAGSAYANAGPHGGYGLFTDKCAACHRAHTATQGDLLKTGSSVYELCLACHGTGGVANTNVQAGFHTGVNERLNGGGFETILGAGVLSAHNVEGLLGGDGIGKAYGSGDNAGTGVQGTLECISCHNPHGSNNYRILRDGDNGYPYGIANASRHRWVSQNTYLLDWTDEGMTADGSPKAVLAGQNYTVKEATVIMGSGSSNYSRDAGNYTQGIVRFCATCHTGYWTFSGSGGAPSTSSSYYAYPGTQDSLDGNGNIARYRHATSRTYTGAPSNPLRFSVPGWSVAEAGSLTRSGFTCLTCHFAHGTTATASGWAAGIQPTNDSALLYYPERGTCRSCHQTTK